MVPIFESDDVESHLLNPRLDAEVLDFIRAMARDGGALLDLGRAATALCDRAVAETEHYFSSGQATRVQDAWYRSSAVRRLACLPKLRSFLSAAYGRDPFPFQTLNFQRGSQQDLHTDVTHFSSLPERFMCGVWIALEDISPASGPLIYKPGSHRLPILTMRDVGVNHDAPTSDDYARLFIPRFAERLDAAGLPTRNLVIKKGQAFVWAANLAHGGSPIADPRSTRRSLVVHFYFDRCLYFTPMLSAVESGRLDLRLPPNARTGLWNWPMRDGRPARLPMTTIRQAVAVRRRGQPHLFQ